MSKANLKSELSSKLKKPKDKIRVDIAFQSLKYVCQLQQFDKEQ